MNRPYLPRCTSSSQRASSRLPSANCWQTLAPPRWRSSFPGVLAASPGLPRRRAFPRAAPAFSLGCLASILADGCATECHRAGQCVGEGQSQA